MKRKFLLTLTIAAGSLFATAQQQAMPDQEIWSPEPKPVSPGIDERHIPSDALVLFDGKSMGEWVSAGDSLSPANWIVADGVVTVNKKAGSIQTRRKFLDYQLHIEWRIPADISGEGQSRGNSGIFLASTGPGDDGYELQVLDSYQHKTYVNGQAGAVYKQFAPLVNACVKPGEWEIYDIIWTAPRFHEDGTLKSPARITVLQNGILIQNNISLLGRTAYGSDGPGYKKHGATSLKLQAHGDPSKPISYRNIWIRNL